MTKDDTPDPPCFQERNQSFICCQEGWKGRMLACDQIDEGLHLRSSHPHRPYHRSKHLKQIVARFWQELKVALK